MLAGLSMHRLPSEMGLHSHFNTGSGASAARCVACSQQLLMVSSDHLAADAERLLQHVWPTGAVHVLGASLGGMAAQAGFCC